MLGQDEAPERPEPGDAAGATITPQPPVATRKRIILLSDGTGNGSGKLFKTNVWRMYQALDLGPGGAQTIQIANYDNGVGNSSFKPLAILGGVFGIGLKRNILHLYRYLCRNYTEGDEIFAFGFSRGAFTIRLLVALIGSQGVVPYTDERDLARQSADAYREFCRANRANVLSWGTSVTRWFRDLFLRVWRWNKPPYRPGRENTPVRFVGVWDTVAAYGGPIIEITRAIDDWLWPLTMTDYRLGDHVVAARHALALDDERDAFQPLLWDEFHERRRARAIAETDAQAGEAAAARLQQVWFTGMHADVGGGYPDDSLSYVSLNWMIGHARAAGLVFLGGEAQRIAATANSFGPMHDSRDGMGVYYRYQPRKIEALLHVGTAEAPGAPGARPMSETLILRDPRVGEKPERPRGLLLSCAVHESVLARIATGTDNYAPIVLPRCFTVAPPPPPGDGNAPAAPPLIAPAVVQALSAAAEERAVRQEVIWNWVWLRRWTYFATLFLSLSLVAMPWWQPSAPTIPAYSDGRWFLGSVIGWLDYVLPSFAHRWVEAFAAGSIYFLGICAGIGVLMIVATAQELKLRDRTRELWWKAMEPGRAPGDPLPGATDSRLSRIRTSRAYQAPLQWVKWRLLPSVIGPAMIALILYAIVIIVTQGLLTVQERRDLFCGARTAPSTDPAGANFRTGLPCNAISVTSPSGAADLPETLEKDRTYRITLEVLEAWNDGGTPADPTGLHPATLLQRLPQWLGAPFRRVVGADGMVPLIEIRSAPANGRQLPSISIDTLTMMPASATRRARPRRGEVAAPAITAERRKRLYTAFYTAHRTGRPYMFVNDAAFPDWLIPDFIHNGGPTWFYDSPRRGNHGSARVTIEPVGE
ncbi:DUF2235 domain-containing protein [Sphingomonas quercus]|uniref:DUF2235 domain-containing protein n=1 Tax=Sphingomonas quercus TaxID=2842451 RepID=A0ABS6BGR6_9SPHN|nr:DUF2235 domain-containing protein [Sphingomonas quercus]MBU3077488.1 DUF2235 domain-containing protein [Sphingomonas quercus]